MTLKLYYHPLSSFCMKVLVALYEADLPFEPVLVNLGDPSDRAVFLKVWPLGKFPVLRDEAAGKTVAESSIVLEYLAERHGARWLIPREPEAALRVRALDRLIDLHIHIPMQKASTDSLRPEGMNDPLGVDQAVAQMQTAYDILEAELGGQTWASWDGFSMADCAACPALFYGNMAAPIGEERPRLQAYLARLMARPSFARVLREARPFFRFYPLKARLEPTYPGLLAG